MKLSAIRTTDLRPRPWIIQLTEREREREMERNDAVTLSKQNCCSFNGSHKKCKTSSTSKKRKETSKSSQSNHNSLCITHSPPPQIINLYIFFIIKLTRAKMNRITRAEKGLRPASEWASAGRFIHCHRAPPITPSYHLPRRWTGS